MMDPLQLLWGACIAILMLILILLLEIHRSNFRREHEVMFGTQQFDEKAQLFQLTPKEVRTLEKLVRASKYENKDAVINSANLFETAVADFYEYRNVEKIRDETLQSVDTLRDKLNFMASNPLATICSTRQFNMGDRIDLMLDGPSVVAHSKIIGRDEREFTVEYDGTPIEPKSLVGKDIVVRWTRPEDAVYTAKVEVRSRKKGALSISHSTNLDKKQLRRWVREIVNLPVRATYPDGTTCDGILYDLSAGGILIGLPHLCDANQLLNIEFDLPSFGKENVTIEILRSLGKKNPDYPDFYSLTASFTGAFGWTQERVLQYLFELHKAKKVAQKG